MGRPAAAPTHRKEREEWATESEGLETQPRLKLDHSSCETVGRMAELTCVDDVGRRLRGYQRREVQNVKDVEEVGPKCELGSFSEKRHPGQRKILAKCHIHGGIAGPAENIAAAASWAKRRGVELGGGIGKNSVDPLLFARTLDDAAMVRERQIGTRAVSVPVIIWIAASDQSREGVSRVLAHDSADGPPTQRSPHEIVTCAEEWDLPQSIHHKIVPHVEIGTSAIDELVAGVALLETNLIG